MAPIVLASASPRRRELLTQMGLAFSVQPVDIDETPEAGEAPDDYVRRLACAKAEAGLAACGDSHAWVLGSDTTVVHEGQILGKPADRDEAHGMLSRLSGSHHQVLSAVALARQGACEVRLAVTDVQFRVLSHEEIQAYWETGEPGDKAGAYGIQGKGGVFVTHLSGSYSAVVGLPLKETAELFAEAGRPVWRSWEKCSE
ncbi:Maf family protein [Marinobacteraceae bacterium S3BR75-40.1]